jgi:hypothetical protein
MILFPIDDSTKGTCDCLRSTANVITFECRIESTNNVKSFSQLDWKSFNSICKRFYRSIFKEYLNICMIRIQLIHDDFYRRVINQSPFNRVLFNRKMNRGLSTFSNIRF